jgi:hypothetical protein
MCVKFSDLYFISSKQILAVTLREKMDAVPHTFEATS